MNITVSLVFSCMVLNTLAQLLLKEAMHTIGAFSFAWHNILPIGLKIITSPYIILGMVCYAISIMVWLLVLSRLEVSVAYPLTSIAFILTAIGAAIFFHEPITLIRLTGIVVIIGGIYLLTRG